MGETDVDDVKEDVVEPGDDSDCATLCGCKGLGLFEASLI